MSQFFKCRRCGEGKLSNFITGKKTYFDKVLIESIEKELRDGHEFSEFD